MFRIGALCPLEEEVVIFDIGGGGYEKVDCKLNHNLVE